MILPFIKTYKKIVILFIILVLFFIYFLNKYNNILDKKILTYLYQIKSKLLKMS